MDIQPLINQYGITVAILIWVAIGAARLLKTEIPNLIQFFQKQVEDTREHKQEIDKKGIEVKRLDTLIAMGSKTYLEEQLTIMASETQSQLAEANEFNRQEVNAKMDIGLQKLESLDRRLSELPQQFQDDLRPDLTVISDNWKATMIEYRHIQTKMTLIINLLRDIADKKVGDE